MQVCSPSRKKKTHSTVEFKVCALLASLLSIFLFCYQKNIPIPYFFFGGGESRAINVCMAASKFLSPSPSYPPPPPTVFSDEQIKPSAAIETIYELTATVCFNSLIFVIAFNRRFLKSEI